MPVAALTTDPVALSVVRGLAYPEAMAMSGNGDQQQPFQYTWKHFLGYVVCYSASFTIFNVFLPEIPPLWSAILVAVLFTLFAVALPLIVARRRGLAAHGLPKLDE